MFGQISKQIVRSAIQSQARTARVAAIRSAHDSKAVDASKQTLPPFHVASQDDVLQVGGSWQEYYDSRQKKYNVQLAASIALFTALMVAIQQTVFFNYYPPELPEHMKKDYYPWREFPSQRN